MAFKGIFTVVTVALLAYYIQITVAFPRDVSIVKTEEIAKVTDGAEEKLQTQQILDHNTESQEPVPVHHNYRKINCDFEEATQVAVCEDHCLAKGYSYGLCVGRRCSCA